MYNLLDDRAVETLQLKIRPVDGCLRLGNRLEVLFPLTLLGVESMVHHKNAKNIELCILGGLVVEEVVVLFE